MSHDQHANYDTFITRNWWVIAMLLVPLWVMGLLWSPSGPPPADTIGWHEDQDAAVALAADGGQPMLLNFTADWCLPCQQMNRYVLPDPQVSETIKTQFVPLKVDLSVDKAGPAAELAERYHVNIMPTLLVIDVDGNVIARHAGGMWTDEFVGWLQDASQALPASAQGDMADAPAHSPGIAMPGL